MKGLLLFLVISSFFGANPRTLSAALSEESFSVKAEIDKAFVTIGERIEYRITVTRDPRIQLLSEVTVPQNDVFEVKEVRNFSEKQGNQIVEGKRFALAGYELGEFILDPVTLRYRTADGVEREVQTNRLYVTVESVERSGKPKTDIRGPKGVLKFPFRWRTVVATLLVFLVATGASLWVWFRNRRLAGQGVGEEPLLSPEEEALVRLNRLFDSDLLAKGKLKEYFLELSRILRRYFERRFQILAVESTTSEILRDLRPLEISGSLLTKVREVLEMADLVKFAKSKPAALEIVQVNQTAKAIVEEARPIPEPAPETQAENPRGI